MVGGEPDTSKERLDIAEDLVRGGRESATIG